MKKFIIFFALVACARADFWSDLWDGVQDQLVNPIVDHAQQTAQNLIDTYVPVLGQAAQQLVGEAIQNAGESLTGLITGSGSRFDMVGGLVDVLQSGIQWLEQVVIGAVQEISQNLQDSVANMFDSSEKMLVDMKMINKKSKGVMKKRAQQMMVQLTKSLSKMAKRRGFFDDLSAAAGQLFQPVVDAATQSFNQLVDAATAAGQQIVDHATNFVDNINNTLQQTAGQLGAVVQPYVDDAQAIAGSVTNQFQETLGADTSA
ncbi:uncharacterized protein [Branchiostoma lanceolatum]|uniref:uncharacterized protein n=1 Tax=Branchiostoma lanceolatum TaxID=7740 RepID=UPI003456F444